MVLVDLDKETGILFVSVPNTVENKNILNWLLSARTPITETYKNVKEAVFGDKEPRKWALEYAWSFPAGKDMLAKLQKRYPTLLSEELKYEHTAEFALKKALEEAQKEANDRRDYFRPK